MGGCRIFYGKKEGIIVYQWKKGIAKWEVGNNLYMSIPFTWLLSEAENIAKNYKKGRVFIGGPATKLINCSWANYLENVPYDVLSFHNPLATFTTRGCPNKCGFCAVPKIEGSFRELNNWKPNPVICDNNILASSKKHFENVIDRVKVFPMVDFNQGLEARKLTSWHIDQLKRLPKVKIRFAFDSVKYESYVVDATNHCKKSGLKDISVYVLIGYNDKPDDALYRLDLLRKSKVTPIPMRYEPLDSLEKGKFVGPNWTDKELKKIVRYYFRLNWTSKVPYEEFDNHYSKTKKNLTKPSINRWRLKD